ncbi:MAG: Trm112 family protein [Desulfobulbus sp.]|nr:MAG: Trm112 family protein [Desulfobulbus sp.]RUM40592.1 MAG: Trm112 family protein [Desulfobulbus sp.]
MKQELLDIIACPQCKGEVTLNAEKNGLICATCNLEYEIRDDIPIMLIEQAKRLDKEQLS